MTDLPKATDPPPFNPDGAKRPSRSSPTIYDIARLAGVNPSTVSRALSRPGRISAKTEKRIQAAAKQLNYRVNPMARSLPTGRTNTIGLIVADITNPMFFDVVRGAGNAAGERDYTLVLAESAESAENEFRAAERLIPTVDGLVLATSRLTDEQIVAMAAQKPVVLINRVVDTVPGIVPNIDVGIAEAIRHLASLGHKAIAYIAGPELSWMSERRWQSLKERAEWSKIAVTRTAPGEPTVEGGRKAAMLVRSSGVTAAIAYNDLMAIGLMQELLIGGLQIPTDVSIVGFDDIFGSDFTTPPLTTIMSPLRETGELAFSAIIDGVDGPESPVGKAQALATKLIIRGSTGRAPDGRRA